MTKWEYRITQEEIVGPSYAYTGSLGDTLNEWGEQGWELVAMIAEEGPPTASYKQVMTYTCTFKRSVEEQPVRLDDGLMIVGGKLRYDPS